MFFKTVKTVKIVPEIVWIWIRGVATLPYQLTIKDWINEKSHKKKRKNILSLYDEKIRPKIPTII